MSGQDTTVNVQPYTGTGQKIRNLQMTVLDDTTQTLNTVLMQVVSIADADGNIINDFADQEWKQEVLQELRGVRKGIEMICGNPFLTQGDI